jgi:nucleoside-triphosphatase
VNIPARHVLLITGLPGVGKTTVIRKIISSLEGWQLAGFYTEEIRVAGERQGFRAVSLDGSERVVAHLDFRGPHRVGKYGVDVSAIDQLAASTLAFMSAIDCYVIDEIGRMECLSPRFVLAMRTLLNSRALVIAAIAQRGAGFIAEAKQTKDADLWEVVRSNRDDLPQRAVAWVRAASGR